MGGPAALLRARLSVRSALGQPTLGLLAGRHLSTNSGVGECLVGPTSLGPDSGAFAADAPPDTLAAGPAGDAAAAAAGDAGAGAADAAAQLAGAAANLDLSGPVGMAIQAVDALHAATGAPWWATISAVGILVRLSMVPITLRGMQASAAALPLLQQAQREVAEAAGLAALPASQPGAAGSAQQPAAASEQQQQQQQQEGAEQQAQQQQAQQPGHRRRPPASLVLARFAELRRQHSVPHPAWIIGSPLIQFPFFVTAMLGIRTMSLHGWEGFSTGGIAWFTDLTLPAADFSGLYAPMGIPGIILPAACTIAMFHNITTAFAMPDDKAAVSPTLARAVNIMSLTFQWLTVPMFVIAMQLPQGALCYWATTSTFSLAQNYAFRSPSVRRLLGLPERAVRPPPPPVAPGGDFIPSLEGLDAEGAAAAEGGGGSSSSSSSSSAAGGSKAGKTAEGAPGWTQQEEAALRHFLATTKDQLKLFERAAELRAEGKVGAAITTLRRLLQLYPKHPRALFALGQMHAVLRDWRASEMHYQESAANETDKQQKARSWFGVGVALHMQGEHETAAQAFQKAAKLAQEQGLRLRAWVSEATLQRKLGNTERALHLLRKAAKLDSQVEDIYLRPLLREMEAKGEDVPAATTK